MNRHCTPASNRAPWTDKDDAELVALERAKTPRRDAAAQLGRTQAATEARIMRLKQRGLV